MTYGQLDRNFWYLINFFADTTLLAIYSSAVPEKGIIHLHGNAKSSCPYVRAAPSVLKETAETYKDPSLHYTRRRLQLQMYHIHMRQ